MWIVVSGCLATTALVATWLATTDLVAGWLTTRCGNVAGHNRNRLGSLGHHNDTGVHGNSHRPPETGFPVTALWGPEPQNGWLVGHVVATKPSPDYVQHCAGHAPAAPGGPGSGAEEGEEVSDVSQLRCVIGGYPSCLDNRYLNYHR